MLLSICTTIFILISSMITLTLLELFFLHSFVWHARLLVHFMLRTCSNGTGEWQSEICTVLKNLLLESFKTKLTSGDWWVIAKRKISMQHLFRVAKDLKITFMKEFMFTQNLLNTTTWQVCFKILSLGKLWYHNHTITWQESVHSKPVKVISIPVFGLFRIKKVMRH